MRKSKSAVRSLSFAGSRSPSSGLSEDRADKLVTACAAIDLAPRAGDKISNVEDCDRFLVRGKPIYFDDCLLHFAKESRSKRAGSPSI